MALGTTYRVTTRYDVDSSGARAEANATADAIDGMTDRAKRGRRSLKRLFGLGGIAAGGAVALGAGAAAAQMFQLGTAAEDARIQIGGTFQVLTDSAATFEDQLARADDLFRRFSERSITSPASRSEFRQLFESVAPATAGLGLDNEQLAEFTQRSVGGAVTFTGGDFEQAGRDIRRILKGRAGAEVKTFQGLKTPLLEELGVSNVEEFNKLADRDPSKVFEGLNAVLTELDPALEEYADSTRGLLATTKELVNRGLLEAWEVAGAALREELRAFKSWFMNSRDVVNEWARDFGHTLETALDGVIGAVQFAYENFQILRDSLIAAGAAATISSARGGAMRNIGAFAAQSGVGRFLRAGAVELKNGPGILKRLKRIGASLSPSTGVAAGLSGAGPSAVGLGSAAGGTGGGGILASISSFLPAMGTLASVFTAALVPLGMLIGTVQKWGDETSDAWRFLSRQAAQLEAALTELSMSLASALGFENGGVGSVLSELTAWLGEGVIGVIGLVVGAAEKLVGALIGVVEAFRFVGNVATRLYSRMMNPQQLATQGVSDIFTEELAASQRRLEQARSRAELRAIGALGDDEGDGEGEGKSAAQRAAQRAKKSKSEGGQGNAKVEVNQTIEQRVESDADPDRIALRTMDIAGTKTRQSIEALTGDV